MNYSELSQDIKDFFIMQYTANATELRAKASNPKARKAAEFTKQAEVFDGIILELKAA